MNIESFEGIRINILYIPERKSDAILLCSELTKLFATVKLVKVKNSQTIQKHKSKVYYFTNDIEHREKANNIAKKTSNIERVFSHHTPLLKNNEDLSQSPNFSIWIVTKKRSKNVKFRKNNFSESVIACPFCKEMFRDDLIYLHLRQHNEYSSTNIVSSNDKSTKLRSKSKTPNKKEILLISKRGKRTNKASVCDSCNCLEKNIWKYKESNHGEVKICYRCKPDIFNQSFTKIDAMRFALQGGLFEKNRKRH